MIKLFISQPMRGRSDAEIQQERDRIFRKVFEELGEPVELIDSYFRGYDDEHPLVLLGRSIELMAGADLVYFARGWEEARGCRIEYTCAEAYDKDMAVEYDVMDHPDMQAAVEKFHEKFGHLFGDKESGSCG